MRGLIVLFVMLGVFGCSGVAMNQAAAQHGIGYRAGLFGTEMWFNSDGEGSVKRVEASKSDKGFSLIIDEASINQTPSVNEAIDVQKMLAAVEGMKQEAEAIRAAMRGFTAMVSPMGAAVNAVGDVYVEKEKTKQVQATTQATTQPTTQTAE